MWSNGGRKEAGGRRKVGEIFGGSDLYFKAGEMKMTNRNRKDLRGQTRK